MKLKGLIIAFFALIFWTIAFPKGNPVEFSPLENLADYYKPILKSTASLSNTDTDFSIEKIEGLYSELATTIHIELNQDVIDYIKHYTTGQKGNFEVALSLGQLYMSEIKAQINNSQLPIELAYLPLSLTGNHNQAITPNNGTGIWGLNYYVAVKAGLVINSSFDERKDPAKSTTVSLQYLSELYKEYKSWNLAITAFATSKALVNKAIQKSGGKNNYWDIAPYLPTEARNIVPAFFATVYLSSFYPEHDMNPPALILGNIREKLELKEAVSISVLAKQLEVSEQTLELMNPTFRGKTIHPSEISGENFYVPGGFTYQIAQIEEELYTESKKALKPEKILPKKPAVVIPEGKTKIVYVVQSGDYLGKIAEKHRVRVSYIKKWNYMRSDRINIGQKLTLYVDPMVAKTESSATTKKKTGSTIQIPESKLVNYTVKEGDTLWGIAKENPGNDVETILSINNISADIRPGQVIKIVKE